jgi:hypothetical protein
MIKHSQIPKHYRYFEIKLLLKFTLLFCFEKLKKYLRNLDKKGFILFRLKQSAHINQPLLHQNL